VTAAFQTAWQKVQESPDGGVPAGKLCSIRRQWGQIAVIAASGGGALAYALSWYGAGSFVSAAFITSGPVYSDEGLGCELRKRTG